MVLDCSQLFCWMISVWNPNKKRCVSPTQLKFLVVISGCMTVLYMCKKRERSQTHLVLYRTSIAGAIIWCFCVNSSWELNCNPIQIKGTTCCLWLQVPVRVFGRLHLLAVPITCPLGRSKPWTVFSLHELLGCVQNLVIWTMQEYFARQLARHNLIVAPPTS